MFLNPIEWPEGKRCAAAVTFDIDADSLIRTARPDDAELRLQPISMGRHFARQRGEFRRMKPSLTAPGI